jgi:hypothetical protein
MAAQTATEFDGWFKEIFIDPAVDLIPNHSIVGEMIKYDSENELGKEYKQEVILSLPHGITFGEAMTAYTLNDSVPLYTGDTAVNSDEFTLRVEIATGLLNRCKGKRQAFDRVMTPIIKKMDDASYFYREMCLLHGGRHIGALTASTDPAAGTTATWTVANTGASATFASGLWACMQRAKVDVYDDPADGGTQRNTGGAITITSVDVSAGTIAVSGDNTSLTNIYNNPTDSYIKPVGSDSKWFKGLRTICGHTSGDLFGISASTETLWAGNTFDAGSVKAGFSTFVKAAAKTIARGGKGDRVALISPATWTDMDIDSLMYRHDTNKKGGDQDLGVEGYRYRAATGDITFVMHPMMFPSEAFLFDPAVFKRIGSTDHTWTAEGDGGPPRFFVRNENKQSFQIRCMWDQALAPSELAPNCVITNIYNNTTA